MNSNRSESVEVRILSFEDIINARKVVRTICEKIGFSLLDQTKVVTAVSELARNIIVHAKEGKVVITELHDNARSGINCSFEDNGPGISNIDQALQDGFSTSNSLGLGLGGSKRLMDQFEISSSLGRGTKVGITKWL